MNMQLSDETILEIRKEHHEEGTSYRKLGEKYERSRTAIMHIVNGKTATHLPILGPPKEKPNKGSIDLPENEVIRLRKKFSTGKYNFSSLSKEEKLPYDFLRKLIKGDIYNYIPLENIPEKLLKESQKLNNLKVCEMRLLFSTGKYSVAEISQRYDIHPVYASKVLHGHYYSDLPLCYPLPEKSKNLVNNKKSKKVIIEEMFNEN